MSSWEWLATWARARNAAHGDPIEFVIRSAINEATKQAFDPEIVVALASAVREALEAEHWLRNSVERHWYEEPGVFYTPVYPPEPPMYVGDDVHVKDPNQ